MIIAWIIGIVLCLLTLWMLKNSRNTGWRGPKGTPILKVWHAIVIALIGFIPIFNFAFGFIFVIIIAIELSGEEIQWRDSKNPGKLVSFLNRTIS